MLSSATRHNALSNTSVMRPMMRLGVPDYYAGARFTAGFATCLREGFRHASVSAVPRSHHRTYVLPLENTTTIPGSRRAFSSHSSGPRTAPVSPSGTRCLTRTTLSYSFAGLVPQHKSTTTSKTAQWRGFSRIASQWQSGQTGKEEDVPAKATLPSKILPKRLLPLTRPHENIYTLPNILTFSRLLCAPVVGYFVLTHAAIPALSLFFYAGVTDLVDGYLARRFNSQTVVGTVIDPMADKMLMTTCVVTLAMNGTFPLWLAVIILGRDVALAISAIYFRWISLPPPKTMARYWDFSLPSAEVHPTEISKINTFLQLLLVGNAMLLPVLPVGIVDAWNLVGVLEGWFYLVGATTVWSGLSYVGNRDAVKILTKEQAEEKQEVGKSS